MKLLVFLFVILALSWATPLAKTRAPIKSRRSLGARIIGGQPAFEGQFPFAAAITVTTPLGRYFCGGALVSNQFILTSAQCVDQATLFSIELGSTHLQSDDENTLTVQATQWITHPDYDGTQFLNDVGLIKLTTPITFTNYIKQIDFLPIADLAANAPARALGWGQVKDDEGGPVNDLQWVMLAAISNDECSIFYQDQLKDGMVCVVGNDNEGTCIGDIGTPLVQTVSLGHNVHVGIASFLSGNGCESTDPSGYTRTYTYKDWIRNNTGI